MREKLDEVGNGNCGGPRNLLVFDAGYSLAVILDRKLQFQVESRDLDGFFDHVWSVHPFATIVDHGGSVARYGCPTSFELAERHTIIEGKYGRFEWLRRLAAINFLIGQVELFMTLWRLIRREKIDIIKAFSPSYLGLFALGLARLTGAKLVIRVGANFAELRKFTGKPVLPGLFHFIWLEEAIERFVLKRADIVGGANQNNLDWALANGASPAKSTLLRYGNLIDPIHFSDPASRKDSKYIKSAFRHGNDPLLVAVGRLENVGAMKHPDDLVLVVKKLRDRGIDVNLLIVGDGPLSDQVMKLACELGVDDRLVLAGSRDQNWLAEVLPTADIYVSPQAGRALSESALAGLPLVAYDVDWQREIVNDGRTGFLVPYRNVTAMVDRIEQLLADSTQAKRIGNAARAKALEMMDPIALDEHERGVYFKLLNGG